MLSLLRVAVTQFCRECLALISMSMSLVWDVHGSAGEGIACRSGMSWLDCPWSRTEQRSEGWVLLTAARSEPRCCC